MAVVAGAYGCIAVAATWYALRPLYLPEPRWRLRLLVAAGLVAPAAVALLPELPTAAAALAEYTPLGSAYYCVADGTLLALPLLLAVRLADRRGLRTGGAAALAAGTVGVLGLHLQCPLNQPSHLLLGHATLPLALLVGVLAFRRT